MPTRKPGPTERALDQLDRVTRSEGDELRLLMIVCTMAVLAGLAVVEVFR